MDDLFKRSFVNQDEEDISFGDDKEEKELEEETGEPKEKKIDEEDEEGEFLSPGDDDFSSSEDSF